MSIPLALLIILALIAGNGFFVALEFALVAVDRSKLERLSEEGNWAAKSAVNVLEKLSFHLSGAQLGITVTSLVLGFLADSVVRDLLRPLFDRVEFLSGDTASILVALTVATIFQLVLGELIPKNIAIAKPIVVSQALSPIAKVVNGVFKPFIVVFNGAANFIVRKIGLEPKEELSELLDLEDIGYLAKAEHSDGSLEQATRELLVKTVKFGDKTAADALRPRVDVRYVKQELSIVEFLNAAASYAHSRFPVVADNIDNVVGQVDIATAFSVPLDERATCQLSSVMKPPLVVPETKELVDILPDYTESGTELAVVVDEHGGTAGILTLEDVLEEIIGEIDDEYDESEHLTSGAISGAMYAAGTLHPDELQDATGFEMPKGNYETLAGFVLAELGYVPTPGDHFIFEQWKFSVVEMEGHRIASVQLEKLEGEQ